MPAHVVHGRLMQAARASTDGSTGQAWLHLQLDVRRIGQRDAVRCDVQQLVGQGAAAQVAAQAKARRLGHAGAAVTVHAHELGLRKRPARVVLLQVERIDPHDDTDARRARAMAGDTPEPDA